MKNRLILLMLVSFLLQQCSAQKRKTQKKDTAYQTVKVERKIDTTLVHFLGEPLLEILLNADSVQSYLLDMGDTAQTTSKFGGVPIYQKGSLLNFGQQDYLTSIVTLRDNYGIDDIVKSCLFNAGVGFEFFYKKQKAQLLVCFDCNEWKWILDEKTTKHEDCDAARPALVQLCKKLFPLDELIKQLKYQ